MFKITLVSDNVLYESTVSLAGQLYLNRQVITLMSGLGVPDSVFLSLQERMLFDLADMMIYEDKAMQAISQVGTPFYYELSSLTIPLVEYLSVRTTYLYTHFLICVYVLHMN
jgi:hypothetical protein